MVRRVSKRKIVLIIVICLLLCAALLIPTTLGRYIDIILGYPDFGVQPFNAAILPVYVDDGNGGQLTVSLSGVDFHPGMKCGDTDTSARIQFYVANGTSEADAFTMPLQYTIRIRTANSLPLRYTLRYGGDYYSTQPDPTEIQQENAENRYEYSFDPTPSAEVPSLDATPVTSDDEPIAGGQTENEATFVLKREADDASAWIKREFELIAEWPSGTAYSKSEYMKEVEIIEIIVTVTTLNGDSDGTSTNTGEQIENVYANGIIVLKPPVTEEETTGSDTTGSDSPVTNSIEHYSYVVDLRSFHPEQGVVEGGVFHFTVDNGVGKGYTTNNTYTYYGMKLKIPIELLQGEDDRDGYIFTFTADDEEYNVDLTLDPEAPTVYRVYDEKTGAYTEHNERPEEIGDGKALYAIYDITGDSPFILINKTTNIVGALIDQHSKHAFTLGINTLDGIGKNHMTFLYKLEILIEADFSAAEPETNTGADTTVITPDVTD